MYSFPVLSSLDSFFSVKKYRRTAYKAYFSKCQPTKVFSVRHFPLARKSLWEESQHWGDDCREGGHDYEAEPPSSEPALVPLSEASLKARSNIQLETEAADR